jgi:hypothetical protein
MLLEENIDLEAYKRNQKEKQWWLSLAYALGRLRVRSLAPLEKTAGLRDDADGRGVHRLSSQPPTSILFNSCNNPFSTFF